MGSALENLAKPQYKVHFLGLGDADCIIISYSKNVLSQRYIAVVDAGNAKDSAEIKQFLWDNYNTHHIDLAVCSHPDRDHKGGFFDLLDDDEMTITEFWWRNPYRTITDDDFARMKRQDSKQKACEKCFNHPTDASRNLLALARKKCDSCKNAIPGTSHDVIPISVLGPSKGLFHQAALGIVQEFAELNDNPDTSKYDETVEVTEEGAKSILNEKVDNSFTNTASIVMLFKPKDNFKLLLAGDASLNSLREIYDNNKALLKHCILKVPHHGSRRNLDTPLIDDMQPSASIICAGGNEKHPNSSLVYYLSKYGNVYSTHKSPRLYYTSDKVTKPVTPLKRKCNDT